MSILLSSSVMLFAVLMLTLLVKKERRPLQQAILGASIAMMILVAVDAAIGTPDGLFIPAMTALIVGVVGTMLYEYVYRRGRTI